MPFSTSQMRAPFFSVRIGGPNGQKMIDLPPIISRLIDSFEYHEIVDGSKASASRITLKFIEGSRAGIDTTGSILDLQFDEASGVKSLSATEVGKSKARAEELRVTNEDIATAQTFVGPSKSGKNVGDAFTKDLKQKRSDIADQLKANKPRFILQERNTVEVTWGYRDTNTFQNLEVRTARGTIQKITHRAAGDSMPTTDVLITDAGSGEFSKQEPDTGVSFTVEFVTQKLTELHVSDYAKNVKNKSAPARIDDIVATIAEMIGNTESNVDLTPEELDLDVQDLSSGRNWGQGTNLHQFLKKLAEKLHAHYFVNTNALNNKTVINIISREKFESKISKHFVWKGGAENTPSSLIPYRTMLNYTLSLFPEGGAGAASAGVDSENKVITGAVKAKSAKVIGEGNIEETMTNSDPEITKNVSGSSKTKYSESSGRNTHVSTATAYAGRMDKGLRLDFTTVGIPSFSPSTIKVSNIGLRYSVLYYALSITHRINATSWYTCEVLANTNAIAAGGVSSKSNSARAEILQAKQYQVVGDEKKALDDSEVVAGKKKDGRTFTPDKITRKK